MEVLLLTAALLPLESSNPCAKGLNMSLVQVNPAPRPKGEVVLTCSISGVPSSDIDYFRWVVAETRESIYEYSERQQVDHMSQEKAFAVTQTPSKTGFKSHLTLVLNVTNRNTYLCQFTIRPSSLCHQVTPIIFEEPSVSLSLLQNSIHESDSTNSSTIDTICSVDVSVGTPTFDLSYNGTEVDTFRILKTERKLQSFGYYLNGSYRTTLVIPNSGVIVCTVSDSLGTYTARKAILFPDCVPTVSPNPSSSTSIVISVTVVVVVGLIIVAAISIILKGKRRRQTLQRRGRTDRPRLSNTYEYTQRMSNVSKYYVFHEDKILKGYFSKEWDWKKIKDLSDDPVLYAGSGPSISDVHQGLDVDDNSWFLAALNSLCLAYKKGHWRQEFHEIFAECKDLKGSKIPIKLWRYGERKTIYVTPSLPTKDGKLCFMHSSNRNVFWSALLQKAYAQEYVTYRGLDGERDIHILEDLTGGVVRNYKTNDYQKKSTILYSALNCLNKTAIALIWKNIKAEENGFLFNSVIKVDKSRRMFRYRVFTPADGGIGHPFDSIMKFDDLFSAPNEFNLLYTNTNTQSYAYLKSFSGKWKHSQAGNYYKNDLFWKNPQYLLRFDKSTGARGFFVKICLAVMQKDTADKNTTTETLPWPLKIGLEGFQIWHKPFRPMHSLASMLPYISCDLKIEPQYTREVCSWSSFPINERYIIVPTIDGGEMPADFLFRVFTDKPHITIVEELPPHTDSEA